ncbi:hypothetical protein [Mucilaginibacter dorajii]|uniref:Peptide-N(4)-(N-acetyl-beta-glucosaminyl)asparagine amidase n=1 Tax=Mucilaginibacter dorajii TaxID=692994 RepID=A0ABP7R016_9SPHI|nr:hypothetical protein [Mucilaginibacter dorajii]MCS3732309.1 hypothetical protein [Mucilaginibacter dorajii]
MKIKNIFSFIGIGLFVISIPCCKTNNDLDQAFSFAAENREELVKMIKHYENEDKDEQKLQAAKYLIINMPHYYSVNSPLIDTIRKTAAALPIGGRFTDSTVAAWNESLKDRMPLIYDAKVIKAQYLIENIDFSFKVWRSRKWSKNYSFNDFCEYILPYRVGNEPLENWRALYFNKYSKILDSAYKGNDVIEAARIVAKQLKKEGFTKTQDMDYPNLGAIFLYKTRSGRCRETCDISLYVMRSLGIPVAVDKYLLSPAYKSQHFWNVIVDTTKKAVPFLYNEDEIVRNKFDQRKKGKIYRETFGSNEERYKGIYNDKNIPVVFRDPYLKDVSEQYFKNEVTIPVNGSKEKYVYLGVFDGLNWKAIDIGEVQEERVTFKNLEENIIYQVIADEAKNTPINFPFILKAGAPHYLVPDTTSFQKIHVSRKYPFMTTLKQNLGTSVGVKIDASRDIKFRHPQQIFIVADTPSINKFVINLPKGERYRYFRYTAPLNQSIQLAELHFYKDTSQNKEIPTKISPLNSIDSLHQSILSLINDNDPVSFYMSSNKGEKLLFDIGIGNITKTITFSPRNDDNFVRRGETYSLFYQTNKGWKLIGRQESTSGYLIFNKVPNNALLWLHDETRGTEEEVFIYQNDKQIFTYDLH